MAVELTATASAGPVPSIGQSEMQQLVWDFRTHHALSYIVSEGCAVETSDLTLVRFGDGLRFT